MNGVHDMGGMHGMGPIEVEQNEPVFHSRWEARVYALHRAMGPWRKWNIDTGRHEIEKLPPADYLRMSYYEKWFARFVSLIVKTGVVTQAEVDSGKPAEGSAKVTPLLTPEAVPSVALNRNLPNTVDPSVVPQFEVGQRVRARNINPTGHTRLPRYARGKVGVVDRDHGVHIFPDTSAHGLGEKRQHCYSVKFSARELWGDAASPRDSVYIDLWDDYLERA
ncbi:MAG: nitrile hydratase subunit beta [Acidobacteria bacterium]|nr:nitrile hydratase subunit beta [Acidobacteriota bacterium]